MASFIETQFPVSKISKESYKERKAGSSQTLTGLGKWWGRKPLILIRATILGCLMPSSDNPKRDMEIFLKILSMDEDGLWLRKEKTFPINELIQKIKKKSELSDSFLKWFDISGEKPKFANGIVKEEIEKIVFNSLGYDEKLLRCIRPEQLKNISEQAWQDINAHLQTDANNLQELIKQLSIKQYGKNITVGDCFCGGGSIPFEAARIGCNAFASDLNPVAGLLTWAAIKINGATKEQINEITTFQKEVYEKVDQEITKLGVEHNELGDRAIEFLYCTEARCPECGTLVPMAPTWVISKSSKTIARLVDSVDCFKIEIVSDVSEEEMKSVEIGTVSSRGLNCPICKQTTPIPALRRDRKDLKGNTLFGLRKWESNEFCPRPDDIYQERLYAVRYERTNKTRYYRTPNERDMQNEQLIKNSVTENLEKWQKEGLLPCSSIEIGDETERLTKERGWTYWHHLFNSRQLLELKLILSEFIASSDKLKLAAGLLIVNKIANWNSKLCMNVVTRESGGVTQTFANQALNTLFNYGTRSLFSLSDIFSIRFSQISTEENTVKIADAKTVAHNCDFWITDPPYADAVNYHELTEFFLAWDKPLLQKAFPEWYTDSKRILAVKGDEHFSNSMISIYRNLTNHMPDNGMQVVMFTHSDPKVWAQLALIMWKAGLRVTAAWNIATETESGGLKDGNYVKGTVLLVLRKQNGDSSAFLDEINADIKKEVRNQIDLMQGLDDKDDPNFSDTDMVLAAYAASLKVLTSYKTIGELNLDYELKLAISCPEKSEIVKLIERAKKIAYDCIIPTDFDRYLWKELTPSERFYIKGLESEKNGNYQISTYQEYARGFAISSYNKLLASEKANSCRLKTPIELEMRNTSEIPEFEGSLLRLILAAIFVAVSEDERPEKGLWHIKNNISDYWSKRDMIKQLLAFFKSTQDISNMSHWTESAEMAEYIHILVCNDHI